jgi:hypothetical protein
MPKLHYGTQTYALADDVTEEAFFASLADTRITSAAAPGDPLPVVRTRLASGATLTFVMADGVPIAFQTDPDPTA